MSKNHRILEGPGRDLFHQHVLVLQVTTPYTGLLARPWYPGRPPLASTDRLEPVDVLRTSAPSKGSSHSLPPVVPFEKVGLGLGL